MSAAYDMEIPSVKDRVSAEEWRVRCDLAALYRVVAQHGWDDLIYTHLSARVPGPEHHFLINPFGMMFEEITASSLVKVDLDGHIVMDTPYQANAAGFTIHSAVHMAREDALCVMHLHTVDGVAVASQEQGLLPLSQHALSVYGSLAYHDYEGVALDLDERERIVANLGDKHCMLLRNHGTLTVGKSVADAYMAMFFLEKACSIQVRALAGGGGWTHPGADVVEKVAGQSVSLFDGSAGSLAWPAVLRRLERADPDFRR